MKTKLFLVILLGFASSAFAVNDLLVLHCEGGASLNGCHDNFDTNPFYGSVDYLDGSTGLVPLATLLNYTCVFTWNNYQYTSGQGGLLADYVDAGGSVVLCGWGIAQCYGRIIDDPAYCPISGSSNMYQNVNLGTTFTHDILNGVTAINNIYFWVSASLESGAYLIANNSQGTPLVAINAGETVAALNMVFGDYKTWSGDGWVLANNTIEYLMTAVPLERTTWGSIKTLF